MGRGLTEPGPMPDQADRSSPDTYLDSYHSLVRGPVTTHPSEAHEWETDEVRETSAGTTLGPGNTRSRLAAPVYSSAAILAFVSPAQRGRTAANSYDFASVPAVAGDDPVNGNVRPPKNWSRSCASSPRECQDEWE